MIRRPPSRLLTRARTFVLASSMVAAGGCAAGAAEAGPQTPAVELELTDVSGRPFGVQDLRGKPVLLFMFATYDSASQVALLTLERFARANTDIAVIGIAAQPQAEQLLPLHRDTLNIRIPLAYDKDEHLINGRSALGRIDAIPSYVLLDANGRVRARQTGALDEPHLEQLVARVR